MAQWKIKRAVSVNYLLPFLGLGLGVLLAASPDSDTEAIQDTENSEIIRSAALDLRNCSEIKPRSCEPLDIIISHGTDAVPVLKECYLSDDSKTKDGVGRAFGFIRLPAAAAALIEILNNETVPERRAILLSALGRTEQVSALPLLRETLENGEVGEKITAANALGVLGSDLAVPALSNALGHFHPKVKQAAIGALGRLNAQSATEPLMNMLGDPRTTWTVRSDIVRTLSRLNVKEAVPLILLELGHQQPEVRREACAALGELPRPYAVIALISQLDDTEVVDIAALALGKLRDERSITALGHAALNPDLADPTRVKAIWAMGHIGSRAASDALLRLFVSSSDTLVSAAVEAAGRIGDPSTVEGLIVVLEHKNPDVRDMARWALSTMAQQDFGVDQAKWKEWARYGLPQTERGTPATPQEQGGALQEIEQQK